MGDAEIIIGLIDGDIAVGRLSFKTHLDPWKFLSLPGIINVSLKLAWRGDMGGGGAAWHMRHEGLYMAQRLLRAALLLS